MRVGVRGTAGILLSVALLTACGSASSSAPAASGSATGAVAATTSAASPTSGGPPQSSTLSPRTTVTASVTATSSPSPAKSTPTTPTTPSSPASSSAHPATAPTGGWPNASNTGYLHAPGYPGKLTTFTGTLQSNHTYKYMYFPGETFVGNWDGGLQNVTFIGCLFAGDKVDDATVAVYSDNVTFDYSTFAPLNVKTPPVAHNASSQYAIDQRRAGRLTVDHSDLWGFANGIEMGWSTSAKPFTVRNSWFHDARADGGTDHTDAILSSDGGPAFMVIDHNTIASIGNTNGLAFQHSDAYYTDITVTNNYFTGFGYTVNIGGDGKGNQRITFTGNTFGTDLKPVFGPLYGWGGTATVWRANKWHVAPGGYDKNSADDGKYWWPDGTLSAKDYGG
ncbi:MAG: hypothetical protein HOW97_42065 [Catenulispora sp.]|nr:hypothetical protein [Catenulispora sp.]